MHTRSTAASVLQGVKPASGYELAYAITSLLGRKQFHDRFPGNGIDGMAKLQGLSPPCIHSGANRSFDFDHLESGSTESDEGANKIGDVREVLLHIDEPSNTSAFT